MVSRMAERLVIIGAGGFGREVFDVVEAINFEYETKSAVRFEVLGFLDDGKPDEARLSAYGVRNLGPVSHLEELPPDVGYVIAIGSSSVRRKIDVYCQTLGRTSPVLVHPSATMGRKVELGPGTVVCSHVSMTNHIAVGRHVHLNLNSTVGHDVALGDYVTVFPGAAISGAVSLETEVMIGTGAAVIQGVTIGRGSVIGAAAGVIRDIPAGTTAVGVPAKPRA